MISSSKVSDGLNVLSKDNLQKLKWTGRTFQYQGDTSLQALVESVEHLYHKLFLDFYHQGERISFKGELLKGLMVIIVEGVAGAAVN